MCFNIRSCFNDVYSFSFPLGMVKKPPRASLIFWKFSDSILHFVFSHTHWKLRMFVPLWGRNMIIVTLWVWVWDLQCSQTWACYIFRWYTCRQPFALLPNFAIFNFACNQLRFISKTPVLWKLLEIVAIIDARQSIIINYRTEFLPVCSRDSNEWCLLARKHWQHALSFKRPSTSSGARKHV